jgi:hypothetical protein
MGRTKSDQLLRRADTLQASLERVVPGQERDWTECVQKALLSVETALEEHRLATEDSEGLCSELTAPSVGTDPGRVRVIHGLWQEHAQLSSLAKSMHDPIEGALHAFQRERISPDKPITLPVPPVPLAIPDFGEIRRQGEQFIAALRHHCDAEAKLVLETVNTDVGVGD